MDALSAYFQIEVAECDLHKTTFMLNTGSHIKIFYLRKTVTGNSLLSDSWLRASNEVIKGLPGIFKQVENLLIGRARLRVTCGDSWSSAGEVPEGSNKVQVGPKVSFVSYVASSMLIPRR